MEMLYLPDEEGRAVLKYVLIIAAIVFCVIPLLITIILTLLGGQVSSVFSRINSAIYR